MDWKDSFDWLHPDYAPVFDSRREALKRLRENPSIVPKVKEYYKENPVAFINDFGMTFDPRLVERGI